MDGMLTDLAELERLMAVSSRISGLKSGDLISIYEMITGSE